jgi:hypothetical protein
MNAELSMSKMRTPERSLKSKLQPDELVAAQFLPTDANAGATIRANDQYRRTWNP